MSKAELTVKDIKDTLKDACKSGDSDAIKAIFKGAKDGGEEIRKKLYEARSYRGRYGYMLGLYFKARDFEIFELLFEGIKLEDDTKFGFLLHSAVRMDNVALFEYLIQTGYSLYKNEKGLTILNRVCKSGPDWAGLMLLEANIDVNHLNPKGYSSLYYAIKHSNVKMIRELIKHKAKFVGKKSIFLTAVETGNLEITKVCWEEGFHPTQEILDELIVVALKNEFIPITEFLIEKGCQIIDRSDLIKYMIQKKKADSLDFLLRNEEDFEFPMSELYSGMSDDDAYITISTLTKHWGSLAKHSDFNERFLYNLIDFHLHKCGDFFIKYLSDNHVCDISEFVLSKFKSLEGNCLIEVASLLDEKIFIILLDFIVIKQINERPIIYHNLLKAKSYKGLKKLLDISMNYHEASVKFLSSIEHGNNLPHQVIYPKNSEYCELAPSFLHKLKDCQDSNVKFHPLVNDIVARKLGLYRRWYILTFIFYCIFLSALYYALFEASYQCDDMLFSYTGSSGAFRAVCEVIVFIYAIIFSIDECMEFVVIFIRFSYLNYQTKNIFKAIYTKEKNFEILFSRLPSIIKGYFGVFNIVDILGLMFLFLLIIFRLASSPDQWTLASLTIIFFTLRLFKYTRISPSLGVYVQSIFRVFIKDITQFSIIVGIIMMAYFGGIHLAARQTYTSRRTTTPLVYSENCSNNSFTGLFWLDEERTSSYDLRRPLLSGIIFLLDGGPGNEETSLLDSNFLFTLLYLSFAFTIIVVMSNILIAQLSQTYAEITKNRQFPFKFDTVVSVEYDSNLAYFFGKFLRRITNKEKTDSHTWEENRFVDPHSDIIINNNEISKKLSTQIDDKLKKTNDALEHQRDHFMQIIHGVNENIDEVKERLDRMDVVVRERLDHMEGAMKEMLSLIQQLPTAATN